MRTIVNKTFDEISPGDTASAQRTLQTRDVRAWGIAFGDAALTEAANTHGTAGIVTAILTALVGSALPGPGSSVRSITVRVKAALPIDAVLTAKIVVREKRTDGMLVILDGQCTGPTGQPVANAMIEVVAPTKPLQRDVPEHRLDAAISNRCSPAWCTLAAPRRSPVRWRLPRPA
jgi:phosphate acetyltransferase